MSNVTGRYVKKGGKIGQTLTRRKPKKMLPCMTQRACRVMKKPAHFERHLSI